MSGDAAATAGPDLADTGERCIPGKSGTETLYEHVHRYLLAATLVDGRDVLDVGSGEGYGAAILARSARSVTAVDADAPSIEHAAAKYALPNLHFVRDTAPQ